MEVSFTRHERAWISSEEAKRITREVILKVLKLPDDVRISDEGQLYTWSEPHPHCGSTHPENIRKATAEDKAMIDLLEKIEAFRNSEL